MGSEPDPSDVTMAELFAGQLAHFGYSATTLADLKGIILRLPESCGIGAFGPLICSR